MSATAFAPYDLILLAPASFLVGLRRGGVHGPAILAVALLAVWYPAPVAIGIGVAIFVHADIQAVIIVGRGVDVPRLLRLLFPAAIGIAVAAVVGSSLPEQIFRWALLVLLVASYGVLVHQWQRTASGDNHGGTAVTILAGFLVGFSSMIGNLATVFLIVYFSAARTTKESFVAISAWFYLAVNLMKLPVHIWWWRTVNVEMLLFSLVAIPAVPLGIYAGRWIVGRLSEPIYWAIANVVATVAVIRYVLALVWR